MNNNKIYKSILYKEIENKINHHNKITKLLSFWKVKNGNNANELYNNFINFIKTFEFYIKLSEISSVEADILEIIFKNKGSISRLQIVSLLEKKYDTLVLQNAVSELIAKFLIYERKSLNNLSKNSFKYLLYNEINEVFSLLNFNVFSKKLLPELPIRFCDYLLQEKELPYDIKKKIYINNGFVTLKEIIDSKDNEFINQISFPIHNKRNNELVLYLVKFDKIIPLLIPRLSKLDTSKKENNNPYLYISMHYNWLNYLEEIFLYLKKNKVSFSQKGTLKKIDYDNILNICKNNNILMDMLFDIMFMLNLVKILDKNIKINIEFRNFLNLSIESKYKQILKMHIFKNIIPYLKNINGNEPFSLYDLIREVSKEKLDNNTILEDNKVNYFINKLDMLFNLGLVHKFEEIDSFEYRFTQLFNKLLVRNTKGFFSSVFKKENIKDSIIVNRDFSVFIYPDKISDLDRYLILSFTDALSDSEIISRRITKKSIQNALYLGYNIKDFIDALNRLSTVKPDEQIINYCFEWEKSFKKIVMKKITVLEGDSLIINTIELDPEINIGEIKKIGDKHIIINDAESLPNTVGIDNIYVYKEDEDF